MSVLDPSFSKCHIFSTGVSVLQRSSMLSETVFTFQRPADSSRVRFRPQKNLASWFFGLYSNSLSLDKDGGMITDARYNFRPLDQ